MAEFSTTTITPADGVKLPAINNNDAPGNMTLSALANYNKTKLDIQDNVLSQASDKPLSANMGYELQAEIDNLKARGRFLSLWNCVTGLPTTNPTTSPYTYKAGDYYIVSSVGSTNYQPSGSSYTSGVASSTVETEAVAAGDFYEYDGTNWIWLINTQKEVSFANLAGNATDNQSLASALNGKQATLEYDNEPTQNSQKMVKSGGIYSAISAIIEWTYLGSATGQNAISLPSEFNELCILHYNDTIDTGVIYVHNIPRIVLASNNRKFCEGGYYSSNLGRWSSLEVSLFSCCATAYMSNNEDLTAGATLKVYYR